ncbi:MAG: hypothetical protein A2015_07500 [Spirochaetes bacterium GWF1_31_7]|nr:MAG: hypothetical protein A2Y30_02880 [Spirochaetes bacterium GWE1_32_154]OHD47602.1 MAG: hypothetical protein A2Y29_00325 [Spirochaetes bacterium GWE2_31_10]OHD51262.1 MAG: hypothetical protein A2015_07500 [Spirochaetes bacterium GWF1_31_7]OHD77874.1 MAG: hypothetical protein A2355_14620 [Spirochaetes bacterium RIFOXYB1_FULL_32_8]HBD96159.1 hypothetical protein [Spirochaetia bacterium]
MRKFFIFLYCFFYFHNSIIANVIIKGNGSFGIILIDGFRKSNPSKDLFYSELVKRYESIILETNNKSLVCFSQINDKAFDSYISYNENNVVISRNFPTPDRKEKAFFYSKPIITSLNEETEKCLTDFLDTLHSMKFKKKIIINLDTDFDGIEISDFDYESQNLVRALNPEKNIKVKPVIKGSGSIEAFFSTTKDTLIISIGVKDFNIESFEQIFSRIDILIKINFSDDIFKRNENCKSEEDFYSELLKNSLPENIGIEDDLFNDFKIRYSQIITNEELLLLVNKTHHLNNDYIPDDLINVDSLFSVIRPETMLRKIVLDDLLIMFNDTKKQNIQLKIISSYRSFESQKIIFNRWVKVLGEKEAKRVSAVPGASQHQLGTAIDFNMLEESLEKTEVGVWLLKNSFKYGFVLSYPKGMESFSGYKYEPWHYRYIGKDAAYIVYSYFNNNLELFLQWFWSLKKQ